MIVSFSKTRPTAFTTNFYKTINLFAYVPYIYYEKKWVQRSLSGLVVILCQISNVIRFNINVGLNIVIVLHATFNFDIELRDI